MLGTFVLSSGYFDEYFTKAQKIRMLLKDKVKEIFGRYDVILMPTSPVTAFPLGESEKDPVSMYLADIYTVFANLTGIPAISVPLFSHSNNMPFSAQIMSNKGDEVILLQLSDLLLRNYKTNVV
jgi:aspartyl-tRNA(Asn)/glutamyl-tRNA(Gln) amidotransferase subunit A